MLDLFSGEFGKRCYVHNHSNVWVRFLLYFSINFRINSNKKRSTTDNKAANQDINVFQMKDNVSLKTGVMVATNIYLNYNNILKYYIFAIFLFK